MDLHHLPEGTHSLAPRPGALDRWTFQIGPRGRSGLPKSCEIDAPNGLVRYRELQCTCNLSGLSGTPLHWATRGWCPRSDLHRHCARFKCAVSALDYVGEMVPREGFPPPTSRSERSVSSSWAKRVRKLVHPAGLPPANSPFEAEDDNNFTTDAEMVGCLGFAPSSRRLRAGTSLSKFATLVAVCKDRDTKAELNHRGQICEVLIDTGISRRGKLERRAPNRRVGNWKTAGPSRIGVRT